MVLRRNISPGLRQNMGKELEKFEKEFADFCGVKHVWYLYLLRSARDRDFKTFAMILSKGNLHNILHLSSFLYGIIKK